MARGAGLEGLGLRNVDSVDIFETTTRVSGVEGRGLTGIRLEGLLECHVISSGPRSAWGGMDSNSAAPRDGCGAGSA